MKNIIIILITIFFPFLACNAQMSFRIGENTSFPDLSIKISESASFADVTVKIGERVSFEDFTVRITSSKSEADFIITESNDPDLRVKASESIPFPDLSIKAGEEVTFPDVTIKIKRTGAADYIIFTERAYISLREIAIALLPAINKKLDYKLAKIPVYDGNNQIAISRYAELKGAKVYAQDDKKTYLGKIADRYDSESIFNEFGTYGSKYSSSCIWNEHSAFGNKHSSLSPFNDSSSKPATIVKDDKVVGYLTTNKAVNGGISPYMLKSLKDKL